MKITFSFLGEHLESKSIMDKLINCFPELDIVIDFVVHLMRNPSICYAIISIHSSNLCYFSKPGGVLELLRENGPLNVF